MAVMKEIQEDHTRHCGKQLANTGKKFQDVGKRYSMVNKCGIMAEK